MSAERKRIDAMSNSLLCREVRRQTCELITLLEMAQPLSLYYLFMEDDFRCARHPLLVRQNLKFLLCKCFTASS